MEYEVIVEKTVSDPIVLMIATHHAYPEECSFFILLSPKEAYNLE
jgi:hypothetical protein